MLCLILLVLLLSRRCWCGYRYYPYYYGPYPYGAYTPYDPLRFTTAVSVKLFPPVSLAETHSVQSAISVSFSSQSCYSTLSLPLVSLIQRH